MQQAVDDLRARKLDAILEVVLPTWMDVPSVLPCRPSTKCTAAWVYEADIYLRFDMREFLQGTYQANRDILI